MSKNASATKPMLCSQFQMRRQEQNGETVKLLPCRNWHCNYCGPNRVRQLRAMAASGLPNVCLTLTINVGVGQSIAERYRELHNAWKILTKRILREFSKNPNERWILSTEEGYLYQSSRGHQITSKTKAGDVKQLHYMAFPEETKKGEAHLHILMRTEYIPQAWISVQMAELINSPVVWIEKIKGGRAAVAYVTKYVTKAPAKFGKSKRYWFSRHYQLNKAEPQEEPLYTRINSRAVRQRFEEFVRELVTGRNIAIPLSRTELIILNPKDAIGKAGEALHSTGNAGLIAARAWLHHWKRELRI